MQSSSDKIPEITALKDYDDFPIWEYEAHRVLHQLDLLKYCLSDELEPPQPELAEYSAFDVKQQKALGILFKSLDKNTQSIVLAETTIVGFWTAIKARFEGHTVSTSISSVMKKAIQKCSESGDVIKHIASLNVHFASLHKLGITFQDEVKIGILYGIMPSYMKEAESLLDETGNKSYSRACNKFIQVYSSKKAPNDQALVTCHDCGKDGHIRRYCPQKKQIHPSNKSKFCRYCKKHGHVLEQCKTLKSKKAEQRRNNRGGDRYNSRYQANNVIGSTVPFVLLTVSEQF